MRALIRKLIDICLLRDGPESIPASPLLMNLAIGIWFSVLFVSAAIIDAFGSVQVLTATASSVLALACFQLVLVSRRRTQRTLPMLTALIGCSAVLTAAILVAMSYSAMVEGGWRTAGEIVAELVWFWSVPVKGHVIARAADLHWYIGIVIAGAIFVMQFMFALYVASHSGA